MKKSEGCLGWSVEMVEKGKWPRGGRLEREEQLSAK